MNWMKKKAALVSVSTNVKTNMVIKTLASLIKVVGFLSVLNVAPTK